MDLQLRGRIALVTGGSGAIGSAIAGTLAEEGSAVAVTYFTNERGAADTVDRIRSAGGTAISVRVDVRSQESVAVAFREVAEILGGIDLLINCAGTAWFAPLTSHAEEDWDRVVDTNLKGLFLCSKAAVPFFAKRAGGDIVNVSSLAASTGSFEGPAYAASKAAMNNLTLSLALELGRSNIRVNAVAPGRIDTPFRRTRSGPYFEFMLRQTPLGRMGLPNEVANAVAFLASRVCAFTTGATLFVTGGLHSVYLEHVTPDPGSKLA